ncbi:MAG: HU family DNA-binding protein [Planctomycetota bacterium]|nr:HU family DNA-binding protein [Planctomycetota bacterium]
MTRAGLVKAIAQNVNSTNAHAERILDAFLGAVKNGLQSDGTVQLIGFGTFLVKEMAARNGRNPQSGEVISIPARRVVSFKVGSKLKKAVNEE